MTTLASRMVSEDIMQNFRRRYVYSIKLRLAVRDSRTCEFVYKGGSEDISEANYKSATFKSDTQKGNVFVYFISVLQGFVAPIYQTTTAFFNDNTF